MTRTLKICLLVAAMTLGSVLPPQLAGSGSLAIECCAQSKSKSKSKKKSTRQYKKRYNSRKQWQRYSRNGKYRNQSTAQEYEPEEVDRIVSTPVEANPAHLKAGTAMQANNALLAVGIPKGVSNQVINYQAMRVNFNPSWRIPNCVSYALTATMVDMADAPDHEVRKNYNYNKDPKVKNCPDYWEYKESGYSRGHMAPAMDMRWDKTAMTQCFYMTNMCPQDTKLNNDHWRVLEEKIHRWAKRDKLIMVYTGPIVGKNPKRIGKDKQDIAVPDAFYKVLYVPSKGRSIAFIYENRPCPGSYRNYAVTVAEVERRTGLTFPASIPKQQCKPADWE